MNTQELMKEIQQYSIDELELIYDTQKDLYSSDELEVIYQQIQAVRRKEEEAKKAWIEQNLPKEIVCPKCEGPNPFENNECAFCGCVFDKAKYYDPDFYNPYEEGGAPNNDVKGESHTFQCVISFLIPLVGFILGAILLGKDKEEDKSLGKTCIILGIVSVVVGTLLVFLLNISMFV